jgi:glycosyltransferase involved in cell wall biosynthesis
VVLRLPLGLQRLVNLVRYRRAGLRQVVVGIAPDIFHAHYLVEHGFYGTAAGWHPYVVSAWGSDVLVDAATSRLSQAIARFVIRRAELSTANNRHMLREMVLRLGAERAWAQHIVLGVPRDFFPRGEQSANSRGPSPNRRPVVLSTRSLDLPLYNVDAIIRAMQRVLELQPATRFVIAGEGRLEAELQALAERLNVPAEFRGTLTQDELKTAMLDAEVFVSVPSSDATSVAVLQAMACGSFPIVSDLPSQQELVQEGVNGFRVPVGDGVVLAQAIVKALEDPVLRQDGVDRNRRFVEEYGLLETNMARMEAWYYRLAGRAREFNKQPPDSPRP